MSVGLVLLTFTPTVSGAVPLSEILAVDEVQIVHLRWKGDPPALPRVTPLFGGSRFRVAWATEVDTLYDLEVSLNMKEWVTAFDFIAQITGTDATGYPFSFQTASLLDNTPIPFTAEEDYRLLEILKLRPVFEYFLQVEENMFSGEDRSLPRY